jgi:hypothetical protein
MHWQEVEREGACRVVIQPGPHFSRPVRTDRVQDHVDRLVGWRLFIEYGEQFAELTRAVLEANHATHLAVIDAKASQQVHGAVADVFELAPRWVRLRRVAATRGRRPGWPSWSAHAIKTLDAANQLIRFGSRVQVAEWLARQGPN